MKIEAIIPAFNEEKTIGNVLGVLKDVDIITRIIVVSDGSTDGTAFIARSMGVDVIELADNLGKGGAMKKGLENCCADIILFLDADLVGLRKSHVIKLLEPVMACRAEMSIGVFKGGRLATDLAQKISPFLSGQRAVKRSVLENITCMEETKFGIEAALTIYAEKCNLRVEEVELIDMTHCTKEEKLGLIRGFAARLKMYYDILKCLRPQKVK